MVALIVLDPHAVGHYARAHGLEHLALPELIAHPDLRHHIADAVRQANTKLSRVEQIKRFRILPAEWSPGSDELPSTIRRDLDALTRAGRVHRTHGGARRVGANPGDIPYAVKLGEQRAQKTAIATAAAAMVQDGDTVILDSGSTTYEIATALHLKRNLTIITNDLRIARFVATLPDTRLLVTGGELLGSVFILVGDRAVEFLGDYTADRTFLGADAVDPGAGITNTNTLEIPLKRAMITAAESTVVVCDSSKFGKRALARVAGLHEVSLIITDEGLPEHDGDEYGQHLTRVPLPAPQRLAVSERS